MTARGAGHEAAGALRRGVGVPVLRHQADHAAGQRAGHGPSRAEVGLVEGARLGGAQPARAALPFARPGADLLLVLLPRLDRKGLQAAPDPAGHEPHVAVVGGVRLGVDGAHELAAVEGAEQAAVRAAVPLVGVPGPELEDGVAGDAAGHVPEGAEPPLVHRHLLGPDRRRAASPQEAAQQPPLGARHLAQGAW